MTILDRFHCTINRIGYTLESVSYSTGAMAKGLDGEGGRSGSGSLWIAWVPYGLLLVIVQSAMQLYVLAERPTYSWSHCSGSGLRCTVGTALTFTSRRALLAFHKATLHPFTLVGCPLATAASPKTVLTWIGV